MNQKYQRQCLNMDHTVPQYICLLDDCNQKTRLVCQQCFQNQNHKHQQENLGHLIQIQDFKFQLYKQQQQLRHSEIQQKCLVQSSIIRLNKIITLCSNQITKITYPYKIRNIKKIYCLRTINIIREVIHRSFKFIGELQQVYQIIQKNEYINNYNKLISDPEGYFEQIDLRINDLLLMRQNVIKQNQQFKQNLLTFYQELSLISQDFNQICQIELLFINRQYQERNYKDNYLQYFEYDMEIGEQQLTIDSSFIHIMSPNGKFFVFGPFCCAQHSIVSNLQNKDEQFLPIVKIKCCKFSNDSGLFYTGDNSGTISSFYVNENFKKKCFRQVHSGYIRDLTPINKNLIITCSSDRCIKVLSTKNFKYLLTIHNAHQGKISKVEFNFSRKLIISSSVDRSIKIHNLNGFQIINQQNIHGKGGAKQIQFINCDNNLLSRGQTEIKLWFVDYEKQQLILIRSFEFSLQNMYSINNDRNLVLINGDSIKILDHEFKFVYEHRENYNLFNLYRSQKLSSEKFISYIRLSFNNGQFYWKFTVDKLIL